MSESAILRTLNNDRCMPWFVQALPPAARYASGCARDNRHPQGSSALPHYSDLRMPAQPGKHRSLLRLDPIALVFEHGDERLGEPRKALIPVDSPLECACNFEGRKSVTQTTQSAHRVSNLRTPHSKGLYSREASLREPLGGGVPFRVLAGRRWQGRRVDSSVLSRDVAESRSLWKIHRL